MSAHSRVILNVGWISLSMLSLAALLLLFFSNERSSIPEHGNDMEQAQKVAAAFDQVMSGQSVSITSGYPFLGTLFFRTAYRHPLELPFGRAWNLHLLLAVFFTILFLGAFVEGKGAAFLLPVTLISAWLFHPILLFGRFDILVMLALLLTLKTHMSRKNILCGIMFTVAVGLKFIPILLLPLLWCSKSPSERKKFFTGVCAGIGGIVLLAMLTIGPMELIKSTTHFFWYRGSHAVQIESVLSGIDTLVRNIFGGKAHFGQFPGDNATWNLDFPRSTTMLMLFVMASGCCFIALTGSHRLKKSATSFEPLFFSTLLWILVSSPIFSPQYLLWVIPLILLWIFEGIESGKRIGAHSLFALVLIVIIGMASQQVFPNGWSEFTAQSSLTLILLNNLRNLCLIVLLFLLWQEKSSQSQSIAQ